MRRTLFHLERQGFHLRQYPSPARRIGLTLFAQLAQPPLLSAQPSDRPDVAVTRNVMVTMRDGVRLATDVYRPAKDGVPIEGRFPVILERTPYNKDGSRGWAQYFAPRGYIAVVQDVRGRYGSEGHWRPLRDDVADGYDTAKWIGEQAWSNGGIGTVGTSYPGGTTRWRSRTRRT